MPNKICVRPLTEEDIPSLRKFCSENKPLGLHSAYTYWVICHYFKNYSFVAETENGTIAGIRLCLKIDDLLFFWQVGVAEKFRGQGIAQQLNNAALENGRKYGIKKIQVSVGPENAASLALYKRWCQKNNLKIDKIDTVSFTDPIEHISEFEDLYEITFS